MDTQNILDQAISRLRDGETLSASIMSDSFRVIMSGNASDEQIKSFLVTLAVRIPTGEELFGATRVMRECVTGVAFDSPETLLDTCGTGGAPKTFNVSTAAGIVSASCGARVAKHGNVSRTGRGSAEVLERLGVNIHASQSQQKLCLQNAGICFCFAQKHHPAVAHVMHVRKQIGTPTIFNLLGPLTNPCSAGRQLLGVWDSTFVAPIAEALRSGGTTKSAVVYALDGLDEVSVSAPTRIMFVDQNGCTEKIISPEEFGLSSWGINEVQATTLDEATEFISSVLYLGRGGAVRDMIIFSAGISLFLADVSEDILSGVEMASKSIDTGAAGETLRAWVSISNIETPSTDCM